MIQFLSNLWLGVCDWAVRHQSTSWEGSHRATTTRRCACTSRRKEQWREFDLLSAYNLTFYLQIICIAWLPKGEVSSEDKAAQSLPVAFRTWNGEIKSSGWIHSTRSRSESCHLSWSSRCYMEDTINLQKHFELGAEMTEQTFMSTHILKVRIGRVLVSVQWIDD